MSCPIEKQVCWQRFQSLLEIKLLELKRDAVFVEDDVEDFLERTVCLFISLFSYLVVFECFLMHFNVF